MRAAAARAAVERALISLARAIISSRAKRSVGKYFEKKSKKS
jgi:hypothetical protein